MPKTHRKELPVKTFSKYREPLTKLPNLVENQLISYKDLTERGIAEIFREFSPLHDYSEKKFDLEFISFELSPAKYDEVYAKENKLTYEAPLRARVKLSNKILNTVKEQEIFMADFPLMTIHGTFIINGVERVVVPQLARSFGVFFDSEESKGKKYFGAKIIPSRGVWIELGTESDGGIYVRIDKKRKFSAIALLRVMGLATASPHGPPPAGRPGTSPPPRRRAGRGAPGPWPVRPRPASAAPPAARPDPRPRPRAGRRGGPPAPPPRRPPAGGSAARRGAARPPRPARRGRARCDMAQIEAMPQVSFRAHNRLDRWRA